MKKTTHDNCHGLLDLRPKPSFQGVFQLLSSRASGYGESRL